MSSRRKFRILALDGGGIRGLITARILQDVEKHIQQKTGETISTYFDLIAGTSTGSIVAAALVLGMKPEDIVKVYFNEGRTIFPDDLPSAFSKHFLSYFHKAKYSNEGLKKVLHTAFQQQVHSLRPDLPENYNIKFGEIHECLYGKPDGRARLLILAHNTLQRQTTFFISPSVDQPKPWYEERELWEVCVSSAAAPTFFPPYCFENSGIPVKGQAEGQRKDRTYIDGGVGANTPSLAALVHTLDIEDRTLDDIAMMSIGTGRTTAPYESEKISRWGALEWVGAIADVFMGSQIQISADLCGQIMRSCNPDASAPPWNYLRLQFGLNERVDQQGNFLPEAEQCNRYLYEELLDFYEKTTGRPRERLKQRAQKEAKLSEAMDNADPENLNKLLRATEAFLADRKPYRRKSELNIQESIAHFVAQN